MATMRRFWKRLSVLNQDGEDGRVFTMGEKQDPEALEGPALQVVFR
jgi:hypothetical protein